MKERENINAQIVALNVSLYLCKKTSSISFLTKKEMQNVMPWATCTVFELHYNKRSVNIIHL